MLRRAAPTGPASASLAGPLLSRARPAGLGIAAPSNATSSSAAPLTPPSAIGGSAAAAAATPGRRGHPLFRRPLRRPLLLAPARACPDWRALQASVPPSAREVERSALVNEEVVYLIFQLELDGALQRALNLDAFEAAQQVRARREQVDLALKEVARRKARAAAAAAVASGGGSAEASEEEEEAAVAAAAAAAELTEADVATEGLRLRTEMARAASEERYADAARFRDLLADLERRAKQAAAALEAVAGEAGAGGGGGASGGGPDAVPSTAPRLPLRLGQRVVHRTLGYRGVVVGWDASCCEDDDWVEAAEAAGAAGGGLRQRFYHVLVDARDWPPDPSQPPVAYVADSLLSAPERDEPGKTWSEVYGGEGGGGGVAAFGGGAALGVDDDDEGGAFRHPYAYVLFLGQDAAGDLLPCRQLRDRYNQQRRDVWRPGAKRDDDDEDEDEDGGRFGGGGGGGGGDSGDGGGGGRGPTSLPGIDMSSLM